MKIEKTLLLRTKKESEEDKHNMEMEKRIKTEDLSLIDYLPRRAENERNNT